MAEPTTTGNDLAPIDAMAIVDVSADKLRADIRIAGPENGGADIDMAGLNKALEKKGVVFGIRQDLLDELAQRPVYDQRIHIAEGKERVDGVSAVLTYHIEKEKDLRPKIKEDGKVDFKDLGIIEQVAEGDVLCEKTPPTPGEPGMNVLGRPIPPKPGRDIPLPMGKGTNLSDDKLKLLASLDGQAEIVNHKITVLNTFTVEGDVGNATGNIEFTGNVVVNGGVQTGFTVKAEGNVDIHGIVESASIIAEGSVLVRGGFNGGEKGSIEAGENVTCKFIQSGSITAGGNLETTYIMNASVRCGGSVTLSGKGLIMGGHVTALISVSAASLGSASSKADTIIEVGNDPHLAKRNYDIPKEIQACAKNLQNVQTLATTLLQLQQSGRLTSDKAGQLQKTLQMLKQLKTTLADLQVEAETVRLKLAEAGQGSVKVSKVAYPGVRIIIGSEQFPLQSEYSFTCFTRTEQGISAGPMR